MIFKSSKRSAGGGGGGGGGPPAGGGGAADPKKVQELKIWTRTLERKATKSYEHFCFI